MRQSHIVWIVLVLLCGSARVAHGEEHRRFSLTAAALAALSATDAIMTTHCIQARQCHEANPVLKRFAGSYAGLGLVKGAATTATIVVAWKLRRTHPRVAWALLGGATAVQGTVVTLNVRTLRR